MMRTLAPWGFGNFQKDMERLFDRMGMAEWDPPAMRTLGDFTPTLDFAENKDAFVVKAEIPGIDPQDITVSLENQMLTLKGEKSHEKEQKDEQYYRMERAYGTFARTVRLPAAVDGSKVTAAFKNGLLTVTLPKAPEAKGSTIPVKAE
jgi:HSP20 family protein